MQWFSLRWLESSHSLEDIQREQQERKILVIFCSQSRRGREFNPGYFVLRERERKRSNMRSGSFDFDSRLFFSCSQLLCFLFSYRPLSSSLFPLLILCFRWLCLFPKFEICPNCWENHYMLCLVSGRRWWRRLNRRKEMRQQTQQNWTSEREK